MWQIVNMTLEKNGAGAKEKLWCVELIPKREKLLPKNEGMLEWLAKGIPRDKDEIVVWTMTILNGLGDHREPIFLRVRQRLVVFRDKKKAANAAREHSNESWTAKVREVRVA